MHMVKGLSVMEKRSVIGTDTTKEISRNTSVCQQTSPTFPSLYYFQSKPLFRCVLRMCCTLGPCKSDLLIKVSSGIMLIFRTRQMAGVLDGCGGLKVVTCML